MWALEPGSQEVCCPEKLREGPVSEDASRLWAVEPRSHVTAPGRALRVQLGLSPVVVNDDYLC